MQEASVFKFLINYFVFSDPATLLFRVSESSFEKSVFSNLVFVLKSEWVRIELLR